MDSAGSQITLDADMLVGIDVSIAGPIFIFGDEVLDRPAMLERFPFEAMNVEPESVFARQVVGVFAENDSGSETTLEVADEGAGEFISVREMVRRGNSGGAGKDAARPTRIVQTRVFVARESWGIFEGMVKFTQGLQKFVIPALTNGQEVTLDQATQFLPQLFGGGRLQLTNGEDATGASACKNDAASSKAAPKNGPRTPAPKSTPKNGPKTPAPKSAPKSSPKNGPKTPTPKAAPKNSPKTPAPKNGPKTPAPKASPKNGPKTPAPKASAPKAAVKLSERQLSLCRALRA